MRKLAPTFARVIAATTIMAVAVPASIAQPVPEVSPEDSGEDCPDPLRGSTVSAKPVRGGVAIEFETETEAHVDGLREHLEYLAAVLESHSEAHAAGDQAAVPMPEIEVTVNSIDHGARLTLRTAAATDIAALRELGRDLEEVWATSPCSPAMSMPSSGIRAVH